MPFSPNIETKKAGPWIKYYLKTGLLDSVSVLPNHSKATAFGNPSLKSQSGYFLAYVKSVCYNPPNWRQGCFQYQLVPNAVTLQTTLVTSMETSGVQLFQQSLINKQSVKISPHCYPKIYHLPPKASLFTSDHYNQILIILDLLYTALSVHLSDGKIKVVQIWFYVTITLLS